MRNRSTNNMALDASVDSVAVRQSHLLEPADEMTIRTRAYSTEPMATGRTILLKESASGLAYGLYANSSANRPLNSARIGSDRNLYGGSALRPNEGTHLAATYDGTNQRLCINSIGVASHPLSGSLEVSAGVRRIGGNGSWVEEFFGGYIDEVRVYERALHVFETRSDTESQALGDDRRCLFPCSPMPQVWHFSKPPANGLSIAKNS